MLHKTRAIILHSFRYGDSSLIVHAFTEEMGRQTFLLKGARKSKRNNRSNMFQALFTLDLDIYFRENREMHWIKEASFIGSAPTLFVDITKSTQAIFLSEVLMKTLREEEKNSDLFSFIYHSIAYLESLESASPSFHLLFLFQLSSYLGFYPMNNFSEIKPYFNCSSGSFSSTSETLDLEQEAALGLGWRHCFTADYSSIDQYFISQESRNDFLDSLLRFYKAHHHSMKEIKSLDILRTVFS
ncbi:MAG: DNA repair protein RecO [Bacteroidales bacterium]|jgi:DNA repair protein RecO (recombination protein O)|nr:DNA repair protein RecO [Bacteroidales bacterium]